MVDVTLNSTVNATFGQLPDGVFDNVTTLFQFCCRSDGKLEEPIVLPSLHPFVLFMGRNETNCQEVRGMSHTIEFYSFDDADDGVLREINGSVPEHKTGDNNTLIYFCYYEPVSCGCVTENYEVVAVGDQILENCILRECRQTMGMELLAFVEGGCMVNDKCVPENQPWTEVHGESCLTYECVRKDKPLGGLPKFQVELKTTACRDGNVCLPFNYVKDRGCYKLQCKDGTEANRPYFQIIHAACDDGMGGCLAIGAHLKRDCIEYTCSEEHHKCGLLPVRGACSFNNRCYKANETWTDMCVKYTCVEFQNATYFSWSVHPIDKGCPDGKGNCYPIGARLNQSCWVHECVWNENFWGFSPVEGGCKWHGRCRRSAATWHERCSTYHCSTFVNATHLHWEVQPVYLGCEVGRNQCIEAGETIKRNCITYECHRGGKECGLLPVEKACRHSNGSCMPTGSRFKRGCVLYECVEQGNRVMVKPALGGCRWKGDCVTVNHTWNETCNSFKCKEFQNATMYAWKVVTSNGGCESDGKCIPLGETWDELSNAYCTHYECTKQGKRHKGFSCRTKTDECVPAGSDVTFELRLNFRQSTYTGYGCKCQNTSGNIRPECKGWRPG